jgi:hypothetical protein
MVSDLLNENAGADLLKQMTEHPTTINGDVDSEVWMNKVYYDKASGMAWKYVPGVGRGARIARLHIFKPGVAKILGRPGYKIVEYIASEDLSEVREINKKLFDTADEARQAFWKLTGKRNAASESYTLPFRRFMSHIVESVKRERKEKQALFENLSSTIKASLLESPYKDKEIDVKRGSHSSDLIRIFTHKSIENESIEQFESFIQNILESNSDKYNYSYLVFGHHPEASGKYKSFKIHYNTESNKNYYVTLATNENQGLKHELVQRNMINNDSERVKKIWIKNRPSSPEADILVTIKGAEKVPGTPKGDIVIHCETEDGKKRDVWVSLKSGTKPSDFQLYGGISTDEIANLNEEDKIAIEDFAIGCKLLFTSRNGIFLHHLRYDVTSPITSNSLCAHAIYGMNFSKNSKFGPQNANYLIQGNIEFDLIDKENSIYKMRGSVHTLESPEIPEPTSRYYPHFVMRFADDRNNYYIPKTRLGIGPIAYRSQKPDILTALKLKYRSAPELKNANTLSEFLDKYFEPSFYFNDYYHNNDKVTRDGVLNYSFNLKVKKHSQSSSQKSATAQSSQT